MTSSTPPTTARPVSQALNVTREHPERSRLKTSMALSWRSASLRCEKLGASRRKSPWAAICTTGLRAPYCLNRAVVAVASNMGRVPNFWATTSASCTANAKRPPSESPNTSESLRGALLSATRWPRWQQISTALLLAGTIHPGALRQTAYHQRDSEKGGSAAYHKV